MSKLLSDADFAASTRDFRALYDRITDSMSEFHAGLPSGESAWFKFLVDGFEARYRKWQTDLSLRGYLKYLNALAKRRKGEPLRLIGHAYLHIALDLPRVIGESLEQFDIPHARAADIFRQPNDTFRDAFIATILDVKYAGWRAYLLRAGILSRTFRSALNLAADRLVVWRSEAWINGHALAEPLTRPTGEALLRRTFDERCRVMHDSTDPIEWLGKLTSPWATTTSVGTPVATRFGPKRTMRGPSVQPDDFLG